MYFNLWTFLSIGSVAISVFLVVLIVYVNQQKMKKLEIEKQKIEKSNLQHEVDDAVERRLKDVFSRIEVLEAIVTDKNYDLGEKITRLK